MNRYHPVLLYDGLCPVCNRLNLFVLGRDHLARFRFAPLQSAFAHQVLARHQSLSPDVETVYVVAEPGANDERLLARADAILYVLRALGGGWRLLAAVAALLPRRARNAAYDLMARNRYRFGRHDACALPRLEWRDRFIAVA
ncbi:MAG: DUF393 domain-containing protein [Dehalococcoidia bacterium]|nr:DUF393 domain-containing protein [Dehalococcoidia bacterium]